MLTGMGADGARAMRAMREAGSFNICQDEASCVVFGMPKEAIKLNAAQRIMALEDIHQAILYK
jgi:two-component system chemotaxis response regulator CheB